MSTLLIRLGETIRNLRKLKGLSQEELGEMSGFHFTYIGGLERGERNISLTNLEKVAACLSVTLSDLFSSAESNDEKTYTSIHESATLEITSTLQRLNDSEITMFRNILREVLKTYK
ncbi:helix-turn-helix transcriptional regulator [Paenibacillus sp. CGMCC 1.16610]|uniref:Helix-turn-helix domain-containing protein n=1 Tax=Paenibacillus anseongense TaxID=2682845 RepID=A0ABW9TZW2_9BACL|nr:MULTISPECIES: helix-turn-helix transcriptional regulator [Paenibacillus]MBA2937061.1 helix-turn-helix transcriptional regulator [Paenibacillus sp. CGMCC 1.16610]MVQ33384.1 helix-turn-helix domain-containing protein [Paenibacillus anseongense]